MNQTEVGVLTVDDFLAEERKKLEEDRRTLGFLLAVLKKEQQKYSNTPDVGATHVDCNPNRTQDVINPDNDGSSRSAINVITSKKCRTYNSQVEKERLANLFENAPNFLNLCAIPKKHRKNDRYCKSYAMNKENRNPQRSSTGSKVVASEERIDQMNNDVPKMARVHENVPSNSAFASGRSLFGQSEYEERRRAFLEKKKQEYMEYLSNMRNTRRSRRKVSHQDDRPGSPSENSRFRKESRVDSKNYSSYNSFIEDTNWNRCYNKFQQENYREELDKQIEEKKKLEEERKHREKVECEKSHYVDKQQRQDVMKRIEEDFQRRLNVLNNCKRENEVKNNIATCQSPNNHRSSSCEDDLTKSRNETVPSNVIPRHESSKSTDLFSNQAIETCSIENMNTYEKMKKELYKRELEKQVEEKRQLEEKQNGRSKNVEQDQRNTETNSRVPLYLKNPFMKQNTESWTIDNLEEYQRMKDELYKKELSEQIEKKREIERENRAKAEEADRKLEEKLRKDEERNLEENLRREKALNIHQTTQRNAGLTQESLKNELSKDLKSPSKSLVKSRHASSTDYKSGEKASVKNVTFAPQTYVYSFDNSGNLDNNSSNEKFSNHQNTCHNDSLIIEAPYALAVKNIPNFINNDSDGRRSNCNRNTELSPALPDYHPIPTNTSHSLPEIADLPIPSAVSMSDQAIREYFKTNAFSDLSQIRRMLKNRNTNSN